MKKRIFALLLCAALLAGLTPAVQGLSFGENDNRNIWKDIDHSYDEALLEAMSTGVVDVFDDKYGLTKDTYNNKLQYLQYTNPSVIGYRDCVRTYKYSNNQTLAYDLRYFDKAEEYRTAFAQKAPKALQALKALIPENATELEKVLIAHDYLVSTTAYDRTSVLLEEQTGQINGPDYDASGVFVTHFSVCQGYSMGYKYLLDGLGIPCAVAVSNAANHAWNLVKLGDEWYHVDTSGDDMYYDILGRCSHEYFLLSTETLLKKDSRRADFAFLYDDYNIVFTDALYGRDKQYEQGQYYNDSNSMCVCYGNDRYCVGGDNLLYKNGSLFFQPEETMVWKPNNSSGQFYGSGSKQARLAYMGGDTMYYSTPKRVYAIDLKTGQHSLYFAPALEERFMLMGLAFVEGKLYCTVNNLIPSTDEQWLPVQPRDAGGSLYSGAAWSRHGDLYFFDEPSDYSTHMLLSVQTAAGQQKAFYLVENGFTYTRENTTDIIKLLFADYWWQPVSAAANI